MNCTVCNHPQRVEIEQAILHISPDKPEITLDSISKEYDIPVADLKKHAILHCPLPIDIDNEEVDSIVRKNKMREMDTLEEVALEYLVTLKNVGRRINKYACEGEDSVRFEKLLTKPVSDLYLGLGSEIRQTTKAIADIDQLLNGPKTDNTSGLAALAAAITASSNK